MLRVLTSFTSAALLLSCTTSPQARSLSINSAPNVQPEVISQPLPKAIGHQVKADLSEYLGVPVEQLILVYHSRETWTDGCLGLGGPAESCLAALTDGWQVAVIDTQNSQPHFYRTDLSGEQIRRSTLAQNLPPSLRDRIFQVAQTNDPGSAENFEVVDAQPQTWDGCYGLPAADEGCPEIAILGWRTIISNGNQYLIYHTDSLGNDIYFNEIASNTSATLSLIPRFDPGDFGDETIFQSTITHGTGIRETFMLESDGQLSYIEQHDGEMTQREVVRVGQGQMQALLNQLEQSSYPHFDGLHYQADSNDASNPTIQLAARAGTVEYAESTVTAIPSELRIVIEQWASLTDRIDRADAIES